MGRVKTRQQLYRERKRKLGQCENCGEQKDSASEKKRLCTSCLERKNTARALGRPLRAKKDAFTQGE